MKTIKRKLSLLIFVLTAAVLSVSASGEEKGASTLMQQEVQENEKDIYQLTGVFGGDYDPESIQTITFLDTLSKMPSDAWDVSAGQDGSVFAWATPADDHYYDLYIAGDGGSVHAPANCSYLFAFPNLKSINFNDCFSTDTADNMSHMFYGCSSLEELDVRNFDTSHVTDMSCMFEFCVSLKELDISNFDTLSLTDMEDMLIGCISLEDVEDGDSGLYAALIQMGAVSIFSLEDFKKAVVMNPPGTETSGYVELPEDYNKIEVPETLEINVSSSYIDGRLEEDCQKCGIEFTSAANISDEEAAAITDLRYQTAEDYLNAVIEQLTIYSAYEYELEIFLDMFENISDDIEYVDIPEDNDIKVEAVIMQMAKDAGITEPSDEAYEILMAEAGLFNYDDLYKIYTADELVESLYLATVVEEIVPSEIVVTSETYDLEGDETEIQEESISFSETDETVTDQNTQTKDGTSAIDIERDYGDWVELSFESGSYYTGFEKEDEFSGWGRYTHSDGTVYEGQFEDDEFSGFGTLILPEDNRMVIGEYYDGKSCGLGVSMNLDGDYMSVGELDENGLNGLAAEFGESMQFGIYEDNVCVEEGFENCRQNDDGSLYYGVDQENSQDDNKGIVMNTDDLRIGIYPEGTSGRSLEFKNDGDLYIGDLDNGVYEGEGIYYYGASDDILYTIGSFENGEFTQGVMKHADGSWEAGQFQNDAYIEGSGITSDDV